MKARTGAEAEVVDNSAVVEQVWLEVIVAMSGYARGPTHIRELTQGVREPTDPIYGSEGTTLAESRMKID